jgi:succinate dehydrogenase / fumarate reductase flavoprotein subunit
MQGLADGYFIAAASVADYLAGGGFAPGGPDHPAFAAAAQDVQERIDRLLAVRGDRTPREFHRQLGRLLWDYVGMSRNEAGLRKALSEIPLLRREFWAHVVVPGPPDNQNQSLEYAGRVADYLEFAELLTLDALHRRESAGGHFREESQTPEGEARRDDERFSYVAAWQYTGVGEPPVLHKEPLQFHYVHPSQRSYK